MNLEVGLRVVRGPDWRWGDQDGGEGSVGTITKNGGDEPVGKQKAVVVQWDAGNRCNYRIGLDDKYDLRVYDSGSIGIKHSNIICDGCGEVDIRGIRWKCSKCHDYDLCTLCYNAGKHSLDHEFVRLDEPDTPRTHVPQRLRAKKLQARGLFPNAEVIRGYDWIWEDQDGGSGKTGKVVIIKGPNKTSVRSVAEVEWRETKKKNIYRAGHLGKVDVKCKELGSGGYYYPDHLKVLGSPYQDSPPTKAVNQFSAGDRVQIQLEEEIVKMMQEGHGGWNQQMSKVIGEVGIVETVIMDSNIRVRFPSSTWTLNPDILTKIDNIYRENDVVRIINDMAEVHTLQEGHGGWVDDMALALGQIGRVLRVFPTGDVRVSINGKAWTFNPLSMVPAPGEDPPAATGDDDDDDLDMGDIGTQLKLLSLLDNPAVIVASAAAGDANTLRTFLKKHPHEVNTKAAGKAALHCASVGGHVDVVKAILEFSPDLEVEDEDGDKPLHLCAYSDEDEAARLLMDAGANLNSKNKKDATPLIIAAIKGHSSVLRILANASGIKLAEQDSDGDTALHCAVLAQKNESVNILLEAGADPTLLNFRLFTPIHEAAKIGFLSAVEQFIRKCPAHINIKKDDGYTPLHLAALNDHLDALTVLLESERCDRDAKANDSATALHIAVHQGHPKQVERLVGFGCDLDISDEDGDTPLHMALAKITTNPLSDETPQLKKIKEHLEETSGSSSLQTGVIITCFLVQEGANIYVRNKKGYTPLQLCASDVAAMITSFIGKSSSRKFHNSLRAPPSPPVLARHVSHQPEGSSRQTDQVEKRRMTEPFIASKLEEEATIAEEGDQDSEEETCFLCESIVDVAFDPCGHAIMCSTCAQRAKKCPTCKVPIKSVSKLKKLCLMCSSEEASVTLKPCEHKFCPECARRMKLCFECKKPITVKEGLPIEKPPPAPSKSSPVASQNCPICLTEPKNAAFLCGHQLCWDCAQKVDHCPVCRKFVTHRIHLFQ